MHENGKRRRCLMERSREKTVQTNGSYSDERAPPPNETATSGRGVGVLVTRVSRRCTRQVHCPCASQRKPLRACEYQRILLMIVLRSRPLRASRVAMSETPCGDYVADEAGHVWVVADLGCSIERRVKLLVRWRLLGLV